MPIIHLSQSIHKKSHYKSILEYLEHLKTLQSTINHNSEHMLKIANLIIITRKSYKCLSIFFIRFQMFHCNNGKWWPLYHSSQLIKYVHYIISTSSLITLQQKMITFQQLNLSRRPPPPVFYPCMLLHFT